MNTKMKEIPVNDRPMERLINVGASNLSNEELLAILIKTGTKNISAKALASHLLKNDGLYKNGLEYLNTCNYNSLVKIKGIGKSKACIILAALELGKRAVNTLPVLNDIKVTNASIIYKYYQLKLQNQLQEYFYCVYLDQQKRVLHEKVLFIGTINYSVVHPREIFKEAYLLSASSLICVHNHPSGVCKPSKEDIYLTERLKEVGDLLGIPVIDHIIIGRNTYYSFVENGVF